MEILEQIREEIDRKGYNVYRVVEMTDAGTRECEIQPSAVLHQCYSVTKSFTACGIGLLWDRGLISLDDRIYAEFEPYFPKNFCETWKQVTVRDVLRHRVGGATEPCMYRHLDHPEIPTDVDTLTDIFDQDLPGTPGKEMIYGEHNYYILSRLIEKKSGVLPEELLRREIFDPLGFQYPAWARDPQGHNYGGNGLCLRTVDMAKLGWLYLNGGVWNGKRILSQQWIDLSRDTVPVDENGDYGFAVLRTRCMKNGERYFAGSGDQFVLMCPSRRAVYAFHSFNAGGPFGLLEFIRAAAMGEIG